MTRAEILDNAKKCVCGQRERDYGSPEDNFGIIGQLWTAYLGKDISSVDVAMMMALLKIARIKSGTATDDSFVDLAGYAACGGEIEDDRKNNDKFEIPVNDVVFQTPAEARAAFEKLVDCFGTKNVITISEYYNILGCHEPASLKVYDEFKYGWVNSPNTIENIRIVNKGMGRYAFQMPLAKMLDTNNAICKGDISNDEK